MKKQRSEMMCWHKYAVAMWILTATLSGIPVSTSLGQVVEDPGDKSEEAEPADSKYLLRWKLAVGDVIRLKHHTIETHLAEESTKKRLQRAYQYWWIVQELSEDGTAQVRLLFEDVAFLAENPRFESNTAGGDATHVPVRRASQPD